MRYGSSRLDDMLIEGRVKLHIFEPSMRKIWTVVGTNREHWADPTISYCSCSGFYFAKLGGKNRCYHLDLIQLAERHDHVDTIHFADEEFVNFVSAMIHDM